MVCLDEELCFPKPVWTMPANRPLSRQIEDEDDEEDENDPMARCPQ
jgi:hypothetical protein